MLKPNICLKNMQLYYAALKAFQNLNSCGESFSHFSNLKSESTAKTLIIQETDKYLFIIRFHITHLIFVIVEKTFK